MGHSTAHGFAASRKPSPGGAPGTVVFGHTKPDGAPRKLMDTSKLNAFGWSPAIGLREGLQSSYDWFVANQDKFRG